MEQPNVIEVEHLAHRYGRRTIYTDLNFAIPPGKVYGLLGKNGVGKTTLIKILMGFLRPESGRCRIFGEDSHTLSPSTRARIGLLFEGHVAYEFMSIAQVERFYAAFYPRWDRDLYYNMVSKLKLPDDHPIRNLSCGQRSQVVLGLIMAQQPDLLILDDYSIGLDAGYRRLFMDHLREYLAGGQRTVLLTSHVIQDMTRFVDEVIFLERGGRLLTTSLNDFMDTFRCYRTPRPREKQPRLGKSTFIGNSIIKNVEEFSGHLDLFSFAEKEKVLKAIREQGSNVNDLEEVFMSLEDAFIGYTGRY
ncbi:ABC transporter ATP-binding protein [Desulfosarcina widdelii]|uniref:ABC transporter ATP-binding protein n=1 Tax=Desulfosarcina widdelii TaxID=947919 RepID=A0A5K7ZDH3_9BACT|nr:ABC transporter ATP-binding protein [Desulfosarcina widdelii]BBO76504.1 ABC transporter ATP-binding protein [Desulfosarcina widdelii]